MGKALSLTPFRTPLPPIRSAARLLRSQGYATARVVRHSASQFNAGAGPDAYDPHGLPYIVMRIGTGPVWFHHAAWAWAEEAKRVASHPLLSRIWVTPEDSDGADNCTTGTKEYASKLCEILGAVPGKLGAVRADELLSHRSDVFALLAVYAAARRCGVDLGECLR
jgi:hypothetical protein